MAKTKIGKTGWRLTTWMPNGREGWDETPIIHVDGQRPFFADHPDGYITKLQQLHDDTLMARGPFYRFIGEFKDCLDQHWAAKGLRRGKNGPKPSNDPGPSPR